MSSPTPDTVSRSTRNCIILVITWKFLTVRNCAQKESLSTRPVLAKICFFFFIEKLWKSHHPAKNSYRFDMCCVFFFFHSLSSSQSDNVLELISIIFLISFRDVRANTQPRKEYRIKKCVKPYAENNKTNDEQRNETAPKKNLKSISWIVLN